MTNTTDRQSSKFSAIFHWHSLQTRVTIFTLAFFLIGIWLLAFFTGRMLREDMRRVLGEEQFSTVTILAAQINQELDDRLKAMERVAARITPAIMGNKTSIQSLLEERYILQMMFSGGTTISRTDGKVIADYPVSAGRIGINYSDRDWMIEALKGRAVVGKPIIGKKLKVPILITAVPIFNTKGKVIGVLAGVTDLSKPNFLDNITSNSYGKTGGYVLSAPQHKLTVTATDKSRIMQPNPEPGINPLFDRYVQGFEGSGIVVDSRGLEVLSSAKRIPIAGWLLVARIPTEEAFAPIREMMRRVLLAAIFLTVLAGVLIGWMLRRQLAPVFTTIKTLSILSDTDRPLQPLPITRQDEIGELITGFNHLLTTLRQREEALKVSEEIFSQFLIHSPVHIYIKDEKLRLIKLSDSFKDLLGKPLSELIGKDSYELVPPEFAKSAIEDDLRTIKEGRIVKSEEILNGRVYSTIKFPITGEAGMPCYIGGLSIDITERKHAEEEKEALEERLTRAEKMESLGLLAGGVAHDLNNVLGVIVGYAEMLLLKVDEDSPVRKDLFNIMGGGLRAAAIVQDLLTLARRGVAGRKVLNLNRLILEDQKTPEWEKQLSYHPAVQIKIELEPDLLNISGSSVHLEKTLLNLVANAVEAMPQGGTLTIKTANYYLDKPLSGYDEVREGDYVVLSVTDKGEGIAAADLKRIFEPFYTKKVMGRSGTGLGLAVVWGTVKDHQGYIDVQSEIGKGSTFTVYFPVIREDLTAESLSVSIDEYTGKGESILVVDDIKGQRDLATAMLKKLNYKVTSVVSGEEAVEYLKKNKVDLLVLDMIMDPGMDGLDTYKSILTINPKQKAIIVSGFSESDRVNAAHDLGAGDYVKKPYVIEKLGMAVKKELERK